MDLPTYWVATLGASTQYIDAAGTRTRTLHIGEGKPVIMLHGLGGHLENFVYTVSPLAKDAKAHVYAVDLLGQGMNPRPTSPYGFQDMVDHVVHFMDAIGEKKASIVGLSLGGLIAAWIGLRYPERVEKLCLTTTFGFFIEGMTREDIDKRFGFIREGNLKALRTPTIEAVRERLRPLSENPAVISEEMVGVRHHIYNLPNAESSMKSFLEKFFEERWDIMLTAERLKKIKAPTLVMWGEKNQPPPDYAERAAALIPNSQFHSCAGCGHWPHLEAEEEYRSVLSRFLKS